MKLRTTTPASTSRKSKKAFLILFAFALVGSGIGYSQSRPVSADQYDNKISALQAEMARYQAEANRLNSQVQTLQGAVDAIDNEIAVLQTQINISQAQYDQLIIQIANTESQIEDNQDALGITIADLYVDDSISPVEMLASSQNIGEYLNKQEYRNSVKDQLGATIKKVRTLKSQLTTQKTDVEAVLSKQNAQKSDMAAKSATQQQLLNETAGQESAYQNLVAQTKTQLQSISAQQRDYYASLGNGNASSGVSGSFKYQNLTPSNGAGGCGGRDGYPYCASQDSMVDPWQLYNRECVSYVAWALDNRGYYVGGFNGEGMAYEWSSSAIKYSGAHRTYDPQPGDAVVLPKSGKFAPVGHVMIVDSVGSDGWIHVSQFNFYGTGQYSEMDIRSSGVIFMRFHK
jgi:surface antigen/predicted nuclease with TOPRIM domain